MKEGGGRGMERDRKGKGKGKRRGQLGFARLNVATKGLSF